LRNNKFEEKYSADKKGDTSEGLKTTIYTFFDRLSLLPKLLLPTISKLHIQAIVPISARWKEALEKGRAISDPAFCSGEDNSLPI
jgi:hypothetical protein